MASFTSESKAYDNSETNHDAATIITKAIRYIATKIKEEKIRKKCVTIMKNDKMGFGCWKKKYPINSVHQDVIDAILKYGMCIPHYHGFFEAAKWYHLNREKLPKWWVEWYKKEKVKDKEYKKMTYKLEEELNELDIFAFSHDDGWGAEYASLTPVEEAETKARINEIKKELLRLKLTYCHHSPEELTQTLKLARLLHD